MIADNRDKNAQSEWNRNGTFSANVELHLYVGGEKVELGQIGPGFAILRTPQSLDATSGEIETIVDRQVTRWAVQITKPPTATQRRFEYRTLQRD